MNIMIQFATRGRKRKFLDCLQVYRDSLMDNTKYSRPYRGITAYVEEVFFNIVCDTDDTEMNNADTISEIKRLTQGRCYINFHNNNTKVEAINRCVSDKRFEVLVNASDDMIPENRWWTERIRKGFHEFFPDYDGVLHFNTGDGGKLRNTLCVMGRKYYDRFGYIYHPDYKSFFCDDEFTQVSYKLNKAVYIDEDIFKHHHVSLKGSMNYNDKDDTYHRNKPYDKHDSEVFGKRKYKNYYLDELDWYKNGDY